MARVIMIVEDEFSLQLDSAETIEHAGFEVLSGLKIARIGLPPRQKADLFFTRTEVAIAQIPLSETASADRPGIRQAAR